MNTEFTITIVKNGFIVRENTLDRGATVDTNVFNTHDQLFAFLKEHWPEDCVPGLPGSDPALGVTGTSEGKRNA